MSSRNDAEPECEDAQDVTIANVAPTRSPISRLRIAVVDPNTAVRNGLPLMLPSFAFIGGYASCGAVLAERPSVDVLVFDVNACGAETPGRREVDNIARCAAAGYRVCIYTMDTRPYFLGRCLVAGARGVVLKSDPLDVLVNSLRQVARGETAVSRSVSLPDAATGGPLPLTARQRQVLAGRARGESFHKIARKLDISERTAQAHWSAIAHRFRQFLLSHSPADLERSLGLDAGAAPIASDMTWQRESPGHQSISHLWAHRYVPMERQRSTRDIGKDST